MLMRKLLCSVVMRNEIGEYFIKWNDYDLQKHIHTDKNVHTDGLTQGLFEIYRITQSHNHANSGLLCITSSKNTWESNSVKKWNIKV